MSAAYIAFTVYGRPRGKGSLQPAYGYDGRLRAHHPRATVHWETLVARVAQDHAPSGGLIDGPVDVALWCHLPKPVSAPKRRATWPIRRGLDVDKAVRAVLDACTGIIWRDDSQVVNLEAHKLWAEDSRPRIDVAIDLTTEYAESLERSAAWAERRARQVPLVGGVVRGGAD